MRCSRNGNGECRGEYHGRGQGTNGNSFDGEPERVAAAKMASYVFKLRSAEWRVQCTSLTFLCVAAAAAAPNGILILKLRMRMRRSASGQGVVY